jgi:methionyl-tRNA synthetase
VSGIAEQFTAEELPGKHISVIVNLAPRTIKGIESRGMVLLAEDETGRLTFVVPETAIKNGSPVK